MERKEVSEKYKWKTSDIFTTDDDWESAYETVSARLDFSCFIGNLGEKEKLLEFLKLNDEILKKIQNLAVYAQIRNDEDSRIAKYNAYSAKIGMLFTKYASAVSFFEPELAAYDETYLQSVVADNNFSDYNYSIKRIIDGKPHVLSGEEEGLLSLLGETFDTFSDTFGMINNLDFPFPQIEWKGENVRLSHGMYGIIMHSADREKRKEAYEKYYSAYISLLNTITSNYYGNIKKDVFLSRAYKFGTCLERALFEEDVDRKVYDNLLESVKSRSHAMHRYISDRKKILGYGKQYFYDMYAPLVDGVDFALSYDEAYGYVVKGLAPLGKEYQKLLKRGYEERWLDVEETVGKRSGAYSIACYGVHPYVLLNYHPTITEVFTIAHEMGHSLHTYFSSVNQPYAKSSYKIFVAEVASTVNEVLLLKYMLAEAKDEKLKKYLINYYLDTIRATLHRQTMFAEFEYDVHTMVERGEPVTKEGLCKIYGDIGRRYYGDDIEHDFNISCEWARIPHFYSAFYVYKYATGIISAINIAKRILNEGECAVKDYFNFLSGGSSTDPVSLLKLAGIDLSTSEPFETAMIEFEENLSEFEKLMGI